MNDGDVASAMVTGMLASKMGPPIVNFLPVCMLKRLTTMMLKIDEKEASVDTVTMRMLASTMAYDFAMAAEMQDSAERFKDIHAQVLLLGGQKSPNYFHIALDALEKMLPEATRVEFLGVGHGASGNPNRGGKPNLVADELRRFFG